DFVMNKAQNGDYQRRVRLFGTSKEYHDVALWINTLLDKVEYALTDIERTVRKFLSITPAQKPDLLLEAQKIVHELGGVFPSTYEGVKSLPGIGDYTAGAIMSIAFNKPYAATDGNVIRVLSRYYGIDDDMKDEKARKKIDALNQQLIADGTPQIYTQAMMELGALVCKPSNPQCESCPLRDDCYAYINKKTEALPVLSRKASTKIRSFITLILQYQNKTALIKNDEGLLKGMYLYPQFENKAIEELTNKLSEEGYQIGSVKFLKKYQHIFTHQRWVMEAYVVQVKEITTDNKYTWTDDVLSLPMAIAHRKIRINS
ncbi:MAG: hypothetical protein EOM74_03250, partial [Methanomicrobia archaeon]|nr:hypothetical protein [Methanomicrobia archaeon]